ncbi:hypothetical protein MAPG_02500 [Magnaporthiopsis poae ATCC 64411]|uniref:RNA-binding protein n=1 Tax=Magnaporthiopsis poae (strain ATCC 64411 / 73-15) TaxID=644358 RepID=A0A0C4DRJ1_MAGP6|nr:hypothetical protein MAPG_02500 [Magnaporthiopsis poae ATCC 64411]
MNSSQKDRSRSPGRSPAARGWPPEDDYREPSRHRGRADRYYQDDGPSRAGGWRGGEHPDSLRYDDDDYDDSHDDRGRRRPRSRSPYSPDRYGRSMSPPPRQGPYHTLIMEGLPMEVREDDILDGFDAFTRLSNFSSEHIRSVRLRTNKLNRRICFVEFNTVAEAEDFAERCHFSMDLDLPTIGGLKMETVRVNLNYSRAREDGGRGDNRSESSWTCPSCAAANYSRRLTCYKCGLKNDGDGVSEVPILTGETDEASPDMPSQYLVVRGLEASVTEEVLARGIAKLYLDESRQPIKEEAPPAKKLKSTAPVGNTTNLGARPGSLRRVFLMRDRRTNDSWRYGFAEFQTLEDAQAAFAKFRATSRFTIASKPVTVGFIHTGVFVPAREPQREADQHRTAPQNRESFVPVYNRDVLLQYWDGRAYPSIHDVNVAHQSESPAAEDAEKAQSPGKEGGSREQGLLDVNSKKTKKPKDKTIAMGSQMKMWIKKSAEIHGEKTPASEDEKDETTENADGTADPSRGRRAFGPRAAHQKDTYTSYGVADDLTCCYLCMVKFDNAQDLRDHEVLFAEHAEALQDESRKEQAIARLAGLGLKPQLIVRRKPRDRSDKAPDYMSYADADALHCLICQRRFKSGAALRLHERESEMHRLNMMDSNKVEWAVAQLLKLGKVPIKMRPVPGGGESSQQYRDRAKERRLAFNQPVKPSTKRNGDGEGLRKETMGGVKKGGAGGGVSCAVQRRGPAQQDGVDGGTGAGGEREGAGGGNPDGAVHAGCWTRGGGRQGGRRGGRGVAQDHRRLLLQLRAAD